MFGVGTKVVTNVWGRDGCDGGSDKLLFSHLEKILENVFAALRTGTKIKEKERDCARRSNMGLRRPMRINNSAEMANEDQQ